MIFALQSGVLFATVMSLCLLPSIGALRSQFGEDCSKEIRCDSKSFLTCPSSGKCDCILPDTMVYDDFTAKCVVLAGEQCLYNKVDGETSLSQELSCISGANCTSGACECLPTHFERSDGTCRVKNGYGEKCTHNAMCDSSQHLICTDNKCTCDQGHDLDWGSCKVLAGSSCSPAEGAVECISGATCDESSSTCQCRPMYFNSSMNLCILKFPKGFSCSEDSQCIDMLDGKTPSFLVCLEGMCSCDPTFAVSDKYACFRKLGTECTDSHECIHGAICNERSCQCNTSVYFQNENHACEVRHSFGENCLSHDQCNSSLVCSWGKCACPSGTSFSVLSNDCKVSAGASCNEGNRWENNKECVPNAFCYGGYIPKGFCGCHGHFASSKNKGDYCYAMENVSCNGDTYGPLTSKQCLPGLVCMDRRCTYEYAKHQAYDYETEKCYSFVGGPCSTSEDCRDDDAECQGRSFGVQQCQCKQGFVQFGRECVPGYGAKCDLDSDSGPSCDKVGGLRCNNKGICDCPGLQGYNNDELLCKGLVEARCDVNGHGTESFCWAGSFCKPFRGFDLHFGLCTCLPEYKTGSDRKCSLDKSGNEIITETTTVPTTTKFYYQSDDDIQDIPWNSPAPLESASQKPKLSLGLM